MSMVRVNLTFMTSGGRRTVRNQLSWIDCQAASLVLEIPDFLRYHVLNSDVHSKPKQEEYMSSKPGAEKMPPSIPTFHDGDLVGIVLLPDKQCALFIRDTLGTMHNLVLTGVERLRAENFLEGNIILDITILTGDAITDDDLLFAVSMDKDPAGTKQSHFTIWRERVRDQGLCLVQLSASYGCTLTSLCTGVTADAADHNDLIQALGI